MVSFVPQPVEIVDLVPLHYYACDEFNTALWEVFGIKV